MTERTFFCIFCRGFNSVALPSSSVCQQLLLHGMKLPVMEGIIVMFPPTIVVLVGVFFATEYKPLKESGEISIVYNHPWMFLLATVLGISVNASSVALVGFREGAGCIRAFWLPCSSQLLSFITSRK